MCCRAEKEWRMRIWTLPNCVELNGHAVFENLPFFLPIFEHFSRNLTHGVRKCEGILFMNDLKNK